MDGGYDDGYIATPCLWGTAPGSLVQSFLNTCQFANHAQVLDLGCGEGKNAVPFADLGCNVSAIDCSQAALRNAKTAHPAAPIKWIECDVTNFGIEQNHYDLIIAYGLLHCLRSEMEVNTIIRRIQAGTKLGGHNILCTFNDRSQDLSAHPGFKPITLPHAWFLQRYETWKIITASDSDLHESHPHNNLPHHHSLTRIIAQKI